MTLRPLALLIVLGLSPSGCEKSERHPRPDPHTGPSSPGPPVGPRRVDPPLVIVPPPVDAGVPGRTGLVECDRMLERERRCFLQNPTMASARDQLLKAFDDMEKALRDAAATALPEGRKAMNDGCRQANVALDQTMAQLGCT